MIKGTFAQLQAVVKEAKVVARAVVLRAMLAVVGCTKIDKEPKRKHLHIISKRHDVMMSVQTPCFSDLRLDVDMLTHPKGNAYCIEFTS